MQDRFEFRIRLSEPQLRLADTDILISKPPTFAFRYCLIVVLNLTTLIVACKRLSVRSRLGSVAGDERKREKKELRMRLAIECNAIVPCEAFMSAFVATLLHWGQPVYHWSANDATASEVLPVWLRAETLIGTCFSDNVTTATKSISVGHQLVLLFH